MASKTSAPRTQPAGSVPEGVKADPKDLAGLPDFCRVVGHARPEHGSDVLFEVWLPTEGWTGQILGAGNGAFAGSISYGPLAAAVRRRRRDCGGGPGASPLDAAAPPSAGPDRSYAAALREWVERGRTPERLIGVINAPAIAADKAVKPVRERLHCAFPAKAVLRKGTNPDLALSYSCGRS